MTASVRQLLNAFDALSDADKHRAAVEILCQSGGAAEGDLPKRALGEAADELFRALDAEEAGHARADRGSVWIVDLGLVGPANDASRDRWRILQRLQD